MKQKLLSFLFVTFIPIVMMAYDCQVNGIYYNLNNSNNTASVTYKNSDYNSYSGSVVIPSSFVYNGTTYTVTSIGSSAFYKCSSLTSVTISDSVTDIGKRAFEGCSGLTSVTIPNSVTSIGRRAFFKCSSLTSVTIPNSVTSIGSSAFYECSSLTSVTIPNSVTSIGSGAFSDCSGLTSVTIPNSVTSIEGYAFHNCSGLTSVTIPNSVTSIGNDAFSGCSGLTSVTIPNSVTSIGGWAFDNCSGLTSVTIPNSVTSIGVLAFLDCSSLISITVASENTKYDSRDNCNAIIETSSNTLIAGCKNTTIPNSVTSIGRAAFSNCSGLTSVTIPNSVTSIGNYAFDNCSGLTSITIPESVTNIEIGAFYGCSSLTSVTVENPTPITLSSDVFTNCENATLYVPVGSKGAYEAANYWKNFKEIIEIDPNPAITFADNAVKAICVKNWDTNHDGELSMAEAAAVTDLGNVFRENEDDTHISSFNELRYFTGLTSIGGWAFYECSGLTSVTIPNSVTSIGDYAFSGCSGLTSVTIPNSVTSIGSWAFYECSGLKKVIVNDIANWCKISFSDSSSNPLNYAHHLYSDENHEITELVIPNSVTSIGGWAFYGCSGLTSVTIPNSVTSIGSSAFYNCSGLTSVTIPNSVTSIGNYTFYGCSGLTSVTIPNSVTSIESWAFYECSGLKKVIVNDIANWCKISFSNSSSNPLSYAHHLYSDENHEITELVIPNSVTSIGGVAFSGCSGLTSITIPESVTSIGDYAFMRCTSLQSVDIPNTVKEIGDNAFYGCSGLTSVTVENPTPITISSDVFSNRKNATLYVPVGSKGAYEAANYWKDFKEIIEIDPSPAITFADNAVKAICVKNWDTNHDGELSMAEAAAVTELGEVFFCNEEITSFDELQYFTGLTSIEKDAFAGCTNLTSVTIPNSVTSIGLNAFTGCSGLTSITIPNSVTSIGEFAFWNCSGLTSITISDSVTDIGERAFSGCGLTSVIIPNSVTSIGKEAFMHCSGLTSVTIPKSVTSIGDCAFAGCSSLTSMKVESGNTIYDSRNNCNAIIETSSNTLISGCINTTIPNSVTSIGDWAFCYCSGLTSVTIPESVTSIGNSAFSGCEALTSIDIPGSVTSIGNYAFQYCSRLTSVTVENPTPITISSDVFPNRENATLYVPAGSKAAYEAADYWKDFKEIIEEEQIDENNRLYADDATGRSGATVIIPLMLKTEAEYAGMQCVVKLSDGFTLNKVTRTNRVPTNDIIQSNSIGNNEYQLLVYSTNRETFAGNDGALVELHVAVDNTVEDGAYTMQFSDIHVSDVDMNIKDLASAHSNITISNTLLIGDVNNDGKVLVNDIMGVANYILKIPMQNFNEKAADVDGDGRILVNDIMGIANIILKINTQSSNKAPRMEDSLDPQ